jgi:octaheme c-type cytochrome (tetrathionate reductase family)
MTSPQANPGPTTKKFKYVWLVGLAVTLLIVAVPIVIFASPGEEQGSSPWDYVPEQAAHTDHTNLMEGPYASGQEVTAACLECHSDAAAQVMDTVHWTWQADPVEVDWSDELVSTGKANLLNNFCIGIQSNWQGCTSCHAGYGWDSADYFANATEDDVDCLVCHDQSGTYVKGSAGVPVEGVNLAVVAQSVGYPTRNNCGTCHFNGGGGDAVKHGDLDTTLTNPNEHIDVHMGGLDFECITCHRTTDHQIGGRSISVSVDDANQIACTDCHVDEELHQDDRLNAHLETVACQTCHIPSAAVRLPTKVEWDWSTAGADWPEDPHEYLKIKGSFIYEGDFTPEYYWYNGVVDNRYLLGDPIDPETVTVLNQPSGNIHDPNAQIWPFKVHRATQPFDTAYNYLLQPKTVGEGGFWTDFDWNEAFVLASEVTGVPYSGEYGFTRTDMYWPITHMVAPAGDALTCGECHGDAARLDWEALGYNGDPIEWGSRRTAGLEE